MAVLYNIDPITALKIMYHGETDGFPKEDLERNERGRELVVPPMLKTFLVDYGYMGVNRLSDSVRILHPNLISQRIFKYGEGRELPLLIIGRIGDYQVAIVDKDEDDPVIFLLKATHEETQILPSDDTLSEILKVMLCGVLMKTEGAVVADDPGQAVRLLKENGVDLESIAYNPVLRREYSVSFNEERRTFITAEFIEGELSRFFFVGSEKFYMNE